jgi:hypothetical protein
LTDALRLPGVLPLAGLADNQAPPEVVETEAVKAMAAPLLARLTIWAGGAAPPI